MIMEQQAFVETATVIVIAIVSFLSGIILSH